MFDDDGSEYGELGGDLPDAEAALLDLLGADRAEAGWGPAAATESGSTSSGTAPAFTPADDVADEVLPVIAAPQFDLPATHAREDLDDLFAADADGGSALQLAGGLGEFVSTAERF